MCQQASTRSSGVCDDVRASKDACLLHDTLLHVICTPARTHPYPALPCDALLWSWAVAECRFWLLERVSRAPCTCTHSWVPVLTHHLLLHTRVHALTDKHAYAYAHAHACTHARAHTHVCVGCLPACLPAPSCCTMTNCTHEDHLRGGTGPALGALPLPAAYFPRAAARGGGCYRTGLLHPAPAREADKVMPVPSKVVQ